MEPSLRVTAGLISVIIAVDNGTVSNSLESQLEGRGFACHPVSGEADDIVEQIYQQNADIILASAEKLPRLSRIVKQEKAIPVIALFDKLDVQGSIFNRSFDDFVKRPDDIDEIELRIRRLLKKGNIPGEDLMTIGDLVIDMAKFEVSVGGKLVLLTYKEFELLKFLAANQGRVFTREALLNRVWGIDYFGGDRTVDVHVRRLRAKIEDANHSFIDTVRSIGYRFKEETSEDSSKL
jgi:DNA-binding response OmpR family regulator